MCEPTTLLAVSLVLSVATTATSAALAERQAVKQERLAKSQERFQKQQATAAAREAAAQQALRREQLIAESEQARGVAQTAGLGRQSLQRFLLDIRRREGRANAILDRNLELIAQRERAGLIAADLDRAAKQLDIDANRPNAAVVGLSLGADVTSGLGSIQASRARQGNLTVLTGANTSVA